MGKYVDRNFIRQLTKSIINNKGIMNLNVAAFIVKIIKIYSKKRKDSHLTD